MTSTSLAVRVLRALGAEVDYLLPKRLVHGYGLSMKVLPEVIAREPAVLVTVDCGIRSNDEIAELRSAGIDTVLTDHHEPAPELPPALAIVDPKREGDPYPDKRLAGGWQAESGASDAYLEVKRRRAAASRASSPN